MTSTMQSITASDKKLSQTMFLPLAERMVEKLVREEKIEAEAGKFVLTKVITVGFP